jgi:hypothetical protein
MDREAHVSEPEFEALIKAEVLSFAERVTNGLPEKDKPDALERALDFREQGSLLKFTAESR